MVRIVDVADDDVYDQDDADAGSHHCHLARLFPVESLVPSPVAGVWTAVLVCGCGVCCWSGVRRR